MIKVKGNVIIIEHIYNTGIGLCVKKYLYEKTEHCQSLASVLSAIKITVALHLVVCFSIGSFKGQITPEPCPDWSPLGV